MSTLSQHLGAAIFQLEEAKDLASDEVKLMLSEAQTLIEEADKTS